MKKKKNISKGSKAKKVMVYVPKQHMESLLNQTGKRATKAVATAFVANPVVTLIAIGVLVVILFILGAFALNELITNIQNPFLWLGAFAISIIARPKSKISLFLSSLLIGTAWWVYLIYMEVQAMQSICSIPGVGWLICGGWNIATFIPKIWNLTFLIITVFIMVSLISMVRYHLANKLSSNNGRRMK